MKNYLFIALVMITGFSCREQKEQIPDSILPLDKMVNLMIDVQMIESDLASRKVSRDTALAIYDSYKKDLYKKHKINDSIYKLNFTYYSIHPQLLDKVYEKVIDSLSLKAEKAEK